MKNTAALRLKQLRIDLRKTQVEMAVGLYLEQSTYSRYETGQTQMPVSLINLITEKFNISPLEFIPPSNEEQTRTVDGNVKVYTIPNDFLDKVIEMLDQINQKLPSQEKY